MILSTVVYTDEVFKWLTTEMFVITIEAFLCLPSGLFIVASLSNCEMKYHVYSMLNLTKNHFFKKLYNFFLIYTLQATGCQDHEVAKLGVGCIHEFVVALVSQVRFKISMSSIILSLVLMYVSNAILLVL